MAEGEIDMIVTRTHVGASGFARRGESITVSEKRARELEARRLAVRRTSLSDEGEKRGQEPSENKAGKGPDENKGGETPFDTDQIKDLTITEVLDQVDRKRVSAEAALRAEESQKAPRKTLIAELEKRL